MVGSRVSILHALRGGACAAFTAAALCAQTELPGSAAGTAARHEARLVDRTRESMQLTEEGRQAYQQRKYSRAVELFSQALDILPDAPVTASQRGYITHCLSDSYVSTAIDYKNVGRTDEAREMLEKAVELVPDNKRARQELAWVNDPVRTNPALTPQHLGRVEEVQRLLVLANGHYDLGKYDKALSAFNQVLSLDPFNTAAREGMERCYKAEDSYYKTARDSMRAGALAASDALWEEDNTLIVPEAAPIQRNEETASVNNDGAIDERLATIILPRVVFQEATIFEILDSLRSLIRRFEQNDGFPSRPINLTTNFGTPSSMPYKELMNRRVSIDLSEISLKSLLGIISEQTGTTFYTSPIGVEFTLSGANYGPMITRTFHVPSRFFAETGEDEASGDDLFAESSSSLKVKRLNPVKSLENMGIHFPEGASAQYSPSTSTLTVRNTPSNIESIQELVSAPLEGEKLVQLNVKMLEINEEDLKELGFQWLLNFTVGGHTYGGGGTDQGTEALSDIVSPAGGALETAQSVSKAPIVNGGLRSGTQVITNNSIDKLIQAGSPEGFSGADTSPAPAVLSIRGVWSVADVTMIMRGLDQKTGTDLAEAPKIIFSPGSDQQIIFSNVRELFYPESYDPPELSNNSRTQLASPAHPSSFVRYTSSEEREGGIGSTLLIHEAAVEGEGNYVTLSLTMLHNSFDGFINYGVPIAAPMYDGSGDVNYISLTDNKILMPVFTRKCLNTKITVVPGSVLVMGSLLNSKRVRYEDKIPVLGDLPLVGRLFRSEGSENERKALLIFAKVDVVDPSGRDVRTGERPSEMGAASSSWSK